MSQLIKRNSKYQYQAGITLIEVLISLLLMAIIGLGGAYIAARTAVVQRDGNIQVQAINVNGILKLTPFTLQMAK